jgi:uncharacterized membrane protein YhaH (DUF805 family)
MLGGGFFVEYMLMPLKRYADFGGRSRRQEYWLFLLFNIVVVTIFLVTTSLVAALGNIDSLVMGAVILIPLSIFLLAMFIPSMAVQVRRLHDQDRSAWMLLLVLVPFVGGLTIFVLMCLDGTPGANRYGADPKGRSGERLVEVFN